MAEYVFNRGIETIGGVRFRPEHSGFELSHALGMKALGEWHDICAAVSMVYESEPVKRASVKKLMDESMPYATALLAFAKLSKGQGRLTAEDIQELEKLSKQMYDYWSKTKKGFFSRFIICSSTLSISSRSTGCLVGSRKKATKLFIH